jgi:hypothetical protein
MAVLDNYYLGILIFTTTTGIRPSGILKMVFKPKHTTVGIGV